MLCPDPILLDFESRSLADLPRVGGRNYWEHPTSEVLCCVAFDTRLATDEAMRDGAEGSPAWSLWMPGDPIPDWARGDRVLGAHNASSFDQFAGIHEGFRSAGPGGQWLDTSHAARIACLPGALDALGATVGQPKDAKASRFTKSLSKRSKAKKRLGLLPELTPEVIERVVAYCYSDVLILVKMWPWLRSVLEGLPAWEHDVIEVDQIVNDRGVGFDRDLARRLLEEDTRITEETIAASARVFGCTPLEMRGLVKPEQLAELLGTPDATADTITAERKAAAAAGDAHTLALCDARKALGSISRGKLKAGLLRCSPDGRLRDTHRYCGGHTLRWSNVGMQLHNMARPHKRFKDFTPADVARLAAEVLKGRRCDAQEIALLLRACLCEDSLAVCDFAGVESRGLAWIADDRGALDVLAQGRDSYLVFAATIMKGTGDYETHGYTKKSPERDVGKIGELACGYGMGHKKLYEDYGEELDAAGVTAIDVVTTWRDLHSPSVRLWHELEDAMAEAARGNYPDHVGDGTIAALGRGFQFVPGEGDDEGSVGLVSPSGHVMIYPAVRLTPQAQKWKRPELSYQGTKKWRDHLYGGKITENLVQWYCRHLMAWALVRAERAGLQPVLHVHDEIARRADRSEKDPLAPLRDLMLELPEWAEGFPIGAAGFTAQRYGKF